MSTLGVITVRQLKLKIVVMVTKNNINCWSYIECESDTHLATLFASLCKRHFLHHLL